MALVCSLEFTRATMYSPVERAVEPPAVPDRCVDRTERSVSMAVNPDAADRMSHISSTPWQNGRRMESVAKQMVDVVEYLFGRNHLGFARPAVGNFKFSFGQ